MRSSLRIILFLLLLGFNAWVMASITPSMRIKQTVDEVLKVLQNEDLDRQQRRDMVRIIVRPRFDYRAMSQLVLAQNWKKSSAEQQDQFVVLFRELLERTYFSAMDSYTGQTVRMGRERLDDKRAMVQTFINASNKEVPVNYKLRLKKGDWYTYDVTVDGVSLVSNYRTSFKSLVRDRGMDGLLDELKLKVDKLGKSDSESK